MVIGIVELELILPGNDSLKGKRMRIKRLVARMRNTFNVSVAEVDDQDRRRCAVVAVVHVGSDRRRVNRVLSNVVNFTERFHDLELVDYRLELL